MCDLDEMHLISALRASVYLSSPHCCVRHVSGITVWSPPIMLLQKKLFHGSPTTKIAAPSAGSGIRYSNAVPLDGVQLAGFSPVRNLTLYQMS